MQGWQKVGDSFRLAQGPHQSSSIRPSCLPAAGLGGRSQGLGQTGLHSTLSRGRPPHQPWAAAPSALGWLWGDSTEASEVGRWAA